MPDKELEKLATEAAIIEAEELANQPAMPGQEPVQVIDPAQEWIDLARMGADMVTSPIPELKQEWTPERIDAFGLALARCAEHYGWTTGGILRHPLAGLAVASFPLAMPVIRLQKARKEKQGNRREMLEPMASQDGYSQLSDA